MIGNITVPFLIVYDDGDNIQGKGAVTCRATIAARLKEKAVNSPRADIVVIPSSPGNSPFQAHVFVNNESGHGKTALVGNGPAARSALLSGMTDERIGFESTVVYFLIDRATFLSLCFILGAALLYSFDSYSAQGLIHGPRHFRIYAKQDYSTDRKRTQCRRPSSRGCRGVAKRRRHRALHRALSQRNHRQSR
jgi:hypothetical protein